MLILLNLLLFTHLTALLVAATTNVAMPIIARRMAAADPSAKAGLAGVAAQLARNSGRALWVLIGSGVAMFAIAASRGLVTTPSPWFVGKIGLVLALLVLMVVRGLPVSARFGPSGFGMLTRVILLSIIFCSVMAFN